MKYLTAPKKMLLPTNCTGPNETFWDQTLQVEESDIGTTRENYGGHKHSSYKFVRSDIGRLITNRQQGSEYSCWWFDN